MEVEYFNVLLNVFVLFQELQADMRSGGQTSTSDELPLTTHAVSIDTMLIGKPER